MGYDCTLHVIDETLIRDVFVPKLLGKSDERSAFDETKDAIELWNAARAALRGKTSDGEIATAESAAATICQLSIVFCAAQLPYHYERGFCLALWPDQPDGLDASIPKNLLGDPELLFAGVVAAHPKLKGKFPKTIEGNYSSGLFVPAEKVPELVTWVEKRVKKHPKPDQRLFRGLLLVLKKAAEGGLAYWEGTDLPVAMATIMPPTQESRSELERVEFPISGSLDWIGTGGEFEFYSDAIGERGTQKTIAADLSAWPPRFTVFDDYSIEVTRSLGGRWLFLSSMTDRPLYRVHVGMDLFGPKQALVPLDESENGISTASFLGESVVAVPWKTTVKTLLSYKINPRVPHFEKDGKLEPIVDLPPCVEHVAHFEVVRLGSGKEVLLWEGNGYESKNGRFELAFPVSSAGKHIAWSSVPFQDDGFWFIADNGLFSVTRGQKPIQHLARLQIIMNVAPGPDNSLLVQEGDNKTGDLGKLYYPDQDAYIRLEPEIFGDEDPGNIHHLHWSPTGLRLLASTSQRIWAVPISLVLNASRYRASTGRKINK